MDTSKQNQPTIHEKQIMIDSSKVGYELCLRDLLVFLIQVSEQRGIEFTDFLTEACEIALQQERELWGMVKKEMDSWQISTRIRNVLLNEYAEKSVAELWDDLQKTSSYYGSSAFGRIPNIGRMAYEECRNVVGLHIQKKKG